MKRTRSEVASAFRSTEDFASVHAKVLRYVSDSKLGLAEVTAALITEWELAVERFLEDGRLDSKEEQRLVDFIDEFSLTQAELDHRGSLTRLAQAGAVRELLEGKIPERMRFETSLPINFLKTEKPVWAFKNTTLLEDKVQRTYVGQSQGFSVRVLKGVYYRTGTYKGTPIDEAIRVALDRGMVVITTKNIYFAGSRKSIRIPYSKIVSFHPYSDGVGIIRDGANAKMQVLQVGDGWFIHNLAVNLAQRSDA